MSWLVILASLVRAIALDGIEYDWGTFSAVSATTEPHWYVKYHQKQKWGMDPKGEITIRRHISEQEGGKDGDVLTIQEFAFEDCTEITAIHLPDTIKLIQTGAFIRCTHMRTITIGGDVEGMHVPFQYCTELSIFYCGRAPNFWDADLAYKDDMKTWKVYLTERYGASTFGGVPANNVVKRSSCALFTPYEKDGIRYDFDGHLLVVGGRGQASTGYDEALKNRCSSCSVNEGKNAIQKIMIAGSVTGIGQDTFANLPNLQEVSPGPVRDLFRGCFAFCTKLHNMNFRKAMFSKISENSFEGCSGLGDISLPGTLEFINSEAFKDSGLMSVTFTGTAIQSIGERAFQGCTRLTTFNWPNQIKSVSNDLFKGCTVFGQGVYTVPDVIESIGSGAFSRTGITSLVFSDNSKLSTISSSAFSSCSSLSSVHLPSGLTNIDQEAFNGCSWLSTVQIRGTNNGLILGKNVFAGCKKGLIVYYCRTAEATGIFVFGGTENTVYVHQGYSPDYFAGSTPTRVGSKTEIFVPVTQDGLTYTFDGSKLSITGSVKILKSQQRDNVVLAQEH